MMMMMMVMILLAITAWTEFPSIFFLLGPTPSIAKETAVETLAGNGYHPRGLVPKIFLLKEP